MGGMRCASYIKVQGDNTEMSLTQAAPAWALAVGPQINPVCSSLQGRTGGSMGQGVGLARAVA